MLAALVHFSLRFRGVVIALACLVIGYGVYVGTRAKLDVFPEFAPPQVVIQTEASGMSPEEVEQLVTRPLENALNGAPNLEAIRSQSIQGLSIVTVVFKDKTDVLRARQLVSERLFEAVGQLPARVKPPKMGPLIASTCSILSIGLTSTNRSLMELRTFADWTLRPRLLGVAGVAKVDVFGGEVQQIQVQVELEKLKLYGLSLEEVLAAARKATGLRGAGFMENPNQRVLLRMEGQALGPEEIGEAVVASPEGRSIRLRDVAQVVYGPEPKYGDALINGERGVILLVASQFGANTLEVTAAVEQALDEMKLAFVAQQIQVNPRLFRPANFIETALRNIRESLWLGAILIAVVLYLFLLKFRSAFISFIAIPLSLLTAVIVLDWFGATINTISLGGFAIAIGVVVDDAIIDVENILRRIRENQTRPGPRPLFDVVFDASLEVRNAVVYATFIVALVFVPVLAMTGLQGRLFAPLGVAFILATLASLLVALTVTPALCLVLLGRTRKHTEPFYVRWLKQSHLRVVAAVSRRPRLVMAVVFLVCAGAAATYPFFGGEFLPEFREGHYFIHMAAVPGTSLEETLRLGRLVAAELKKIPSVREVSQQAGRAENGEDPFGPHYSEIHVDLAPQSGEDEEQTVAQMRIVLAKFPGLSFKIMPFIVERIQETLSGSTAEVAVNFFGDDLDVLENKAREARQILARVRGAVDVNLETEATVPEVVVRPRRERLRQYGFHPDDVLQAIELAYQGLDVTQVYQGNRVVDVVVILPEAQRRHPEAIGQLLLRNAAGLMVPLHELADITPGAGRSSITHEGARRRTQVSCNVQRRDVESFVREACAQLTTLISLPPGTFVAFAGSAQARAAATRELLVHSLMAAAGILVLLAVVFQSGRNLVLVLANLPFALVGGVLAVFASGGQLSIGTLVGFVTLFGLSTRNSIMVISHFQHLVEKEGLPWGPQTALRGASERLLPILMTAIVTGLGLLPLAIGAGEAGREIEGPMAIVILGGLVTSTLLNLLVLPTMALHFGRFSPARAKV
jgi:CzcA family heavy metal efflux pump